MDAPGTFELLGGETPQGNPFPYDQSLKDRQRVEETGNYEAFEECEHVGLGVSP